jgi:hypothetical protein
MNNYVFHPTSNWAKADGREVSAFNPTATYAFNGVPGENVSFSMLALPSIKSNSTGRREILTA